MQLIILVYHITGAKQDLSIYMFIRVLVSAYIFLNGYGHLHYHWKRQQKSLANNNVAAKETFDSSEIVRCLTVSCLTTLFINQLQSNQHLVLRRIVVVHLGIEVVGFKLTIFWFL